MWTLVEAAERTGVSRATLQRMIAAGTIVGAEKLGRGWKIPTTGLIGAGLKVDDPKPSSKEHAELDRDRQIMNARMEAERHRMRAEALQRELSRADETIADLRKVLNSRLLMLEAAPVDEPVRVGPVVAEIKKPTAEPVVEARRGFARLGHFLGFERYR